MSDPVRLYNPNPDAPDVWGAPPTKRNRLVEALASIPSPFEVFAPPPAARQAYGSLARAIVDSTAPAAVRDTVDASGQTMDAVRQGRGWDAAGGVAGMLTAAAGVLPGGRLITKGAKELAQPIRAYHGSPHDFDRFDMSKIGTGEGAQAYGHGLYFAENEGVAQGYRQALQQVDTAPFDVIGIPPKDWNAARMFAQNMDPKTPDIAARDFAQWTGRQVTPELVDAFAKAKKPGRMYEVNIHADPAKFLDWDKPISAQPALQSIASDVAASSSMAARKLQGDATGATLYQSMRSGFPAKELGYSDWSTSGPGNYLQQQGIPGIKYLDGGSRAAGDGSRNYVAFDDKLIEILRKYGLLPVAAGSAAVAAGGSTSDEGGF